MSNASGQAKVCGHAYLWDDNKKNIRQVILPDVDFSFCSLCCF